jgi:hypothetical protein
MQLTILLTNTGRNWVKSIQVLKTRFYQRFKLSHKNPIIILESTCLREQETYIFRDKGLRHLELFGTPHL